VNRGDRRLRPAASTDRNTSVSAFRNVITDSPQWRPEYQLLSGVALRAFESAGVKGEQAMNALGILRALVRGFVLHEMAASFLDTADYDKLYTVAVDVFVCGLDALRPAAQPA
jgi:hypothetical protein